MSAFRVEESVNERDLLTALETINDTPTSAVFVDDELVALCPGDTGEVAKSVCAGLIQREDLEWERQMLAASVSAESTTREIVNLILHGGLSATEVARDRGYSPVEVAHAVNWIEAHPSATGYEEEV